MVEARREAWKDGTSTYCGSQLSRRTSSRTARTKSNRNGGNVTDHACLCIRRCLQGQHDHQLAECRADDVEHGRRRTPDLKTFKVLLRTKYRVDLDPAKCLSCDPSSFACHAIRCHGENVGPACAHQAKRGPTVSERALITLVHCTYASQTRSGRGRLRRGRIAPPYVNGVGSITGSCCIPLIDVASPGATKEEMVSATSKDSYHM